MDQYIDGFSEEIQEKLNQIRNLIRETTPQATEGLSWSMPTFKIKRYSFGLPDLKTIRVFILIRKL